MQDTVNVTEVNAGWEGGGQGSLWTFRDPQDLWDPPGKEAEASSWLAE